ncbi:alpha/beta hydrolase [Nonomuraea guangzhouensis]|uniref:alpha/beta hydrolase n=1 Tax=Nonomuraea guangzhouensis TaxID=1291555 RepID=UPI0027E054C9|nr:alpha/beta hydrolase [Nonomuraea guangzhouensis]
MTDLHLVVVTGPRLVADPALLRQIVAAECDALGLPGRLEAAADGEALGKVLLDGGRDDTRAIVALPGADPAGRSMLTLPGSHASRTVWYDVTDTGPAEVAAGSVHLFGRGIQGLTWAIRHAVHRLRHPARRISYGPHPDQWADLRLPPDRDARPQPVLPPDHNGRPLPVLPPDHDAGPLPVAVLLHGGYWRSIWGADLMDALSIDLAGRGYAAWNLEYRRPDRHGWDATTADVAAGFAALATAAREHPLDLGRTAVLGHSAGGQLALRLAADVAGIAPAVSLAVSLAGVLDLGEGALRRISSGAVPAALGGTPDEIPEVYAAADPLTRLPLGVPQLIVQGLDDDLDLVDFNRRYAARGQRTGDELVHVEQPGDHFAVIDPASDIWRATTAQMGRRLPVRRSVGGM